MSIKVQKQRVHREWFRPVSLSNRKSCPHCKCKLGAGEWIWSWGEYLYAKWRNVRYVCKNCYPEVREMLIEHRNQCGCSFELVPKGAQLPEWLTLD